MGDGSTTQPPPQPMPQGDVPRTTTERVGGFLQGLTGSASGFGTPNIPLAEELQRSHQERTYEAEFNWHKYSTYLGLSQLPVGSANPQDGKPITQEDLDKWKAWSQDGLAKYTKVMSVNKEAKQKIAAGVQRVETIMGLKKRMGQQQPGAQPTGAQPPTTGSTTAPPPKPPSQPVDQNEGNAMLGQAEEAQGLSLKLSQARAEAENTVQTRVGINDKYLHFKEGTPEYKEYLADGKLPLTAPGIQKLQTHVAGSDLPPGTETLSGDPIDKTKDYDTWMIKGTGQLIAAASGARGASSTAPELAQPKGGGAPYGIKRNGKVLLPGSPGWTPEDQAMFKAGLESYAAGDKEKLHRLIVSAEARARAWAKTRLVGAIDNETGELTFISPSDHMANPGRYGPAGAGMQAMSRSAIFGEIDYTKNQLNDSIKKLGDESFDATSRAQVAFVLRSTEPSSAFSTFLNSSAATTLSDAQINYVTGLVSLEESAMSLRSLAGMGQGSDQLRHAIVAMLPTGATPSKKYAERQMQLFEGEVNQLRKSVPGLGDIVPRSPGDTSTKPPPKSSKGGFKKNPDGSYTEQ